ncbi:hypothetical protein [Mycolicibacterium peregrinum]|uniref:YrhK domain-containing protein n=1 Tax=Mycolicibacterium peregrinum TaxID=43304 RepID=A0A1A0W5R4_MYCPR|nr:hypothetical protein [Mycolicibacterium peregrinum]OBB91264.1 hypothetical protein A5779_24105 [Mycolicibacterium peregrinum]
MTARFATLTRQCWLFAIGSAFFAAATVPGFPALAGAGVTNTLCFVGSWFFTTAAGIQLVLARRGLDWWSAATQFAGTLLFNLSTGASVWAHAVLAERRFVWAPDATGSLAFLLSGVLAVLAVGAWSPKSAGWQAAWINMMGCVAFGVSALAAFVRKTGVTVDERLANFGTFIGALCFLAAALMLRPRSDTAPTLR